VKLRLFTLAALAAVALVPAAQGAAQQRFGGPRTTAPPPVVDIKVTITDTRIGLTPKGAQRGDYARFILLNVGKKPHTFTLGGTKHGTGVQTGFSRLLKPKEQKILLLFLDYRGQIAYRGTLPADRSLPGMKGVFTIS
jgi:hypothetical protein